MFNTNAFVQQYTMTAGAVALASNPVFNQVTLTAKSTNTGIVYVGLSSSTSSANGYALEKGASVTVKVANANQLFVIGTAADILSVIGS
jgi:hypothetical protein